MARVTFVGEVTMILDFFGIPIVTKDVTHQPHALKLLAKVRALGIDVAAVAGTVLAPLVFRFVPFAHI